VSTKVDLFVSFVKAGQHYEESSRKSRFGLLCNYLFEYATFLLSDSGDSITFDYFLTQNALKISRTIYAINPSVPISEGNLYDEGYWYYDLILKDRTNGPAIYNFDLQISDRQDFSTILLTVDSSGSKSGWTYERREGALTTPFENTGISSAYLGRRVRYSSKASQYLESGEEYWFRMRQKVGAKVYDWETAQQVIWT
jgi:hypothetical protein